jgi:hypothetical protein
VGPNDPLALVGRGRGGGERGWVGPNDPPALVERRRVVEGLRVVGVGGCVQTTPPRSLRGGGWWRTCVWWAWVRASKAEGGGGWWRACVWWTCVGASKRLPALVERRRVVTGLGPSKRPPRSSREAEAGRGWVHMNPPRSSTEGGGRAWVRPNDPPRSLREAEGGGAVSKYHTLKLSNTHLFFRIYYLSSLLAAHFPSIPTRRVTYGASDALNLVELGVNLLYLYARQITRHITRHVGP